MEFRKQKPIYLQIADRLMERVLSGELKEEDLGGGCSHCGGGCDSGSCDGGCEGCK